MHLEPPLTLPSVRWGSRRHLAARCTRALALFAAAGSCACFGDPEIPAPSCSTISGSLLEAVESVGGQWRVPSGGSPDVEVGVVFRNGRGDRSEEASLRVYIDAPPESGAAVYPYLEPS